MTRTAEGAEGKKPQTELTRIEAKKNVFITSSEGRTASGDSAEYNAKTSMITMGGDVVLTQGENMVRGSRLLIDMNSGETKIDTAAPRPRTAASAGRRRLGDGSAFGWRADGEQRPRQRGLLPAAIEGRTAVKECAQADAACRPLRRVAPRTAPPPSTAGAPPTP